MVSAESERPMKELLVRKAFQVSVAVKYGSVLEANFNLESNT